jgi:hypothetical protein
MAPILPGNANGSAGDLIAAVRGGSPITVQAAEQLTVAADRTTMMTTGT